MLKCNQQAPSVGDDYLWFKISPLGAILIQVVEEISSCAVLKGEVLMVSCQFRFLHLHYIGTEGSVVKFLKDYALSRIHLGVGIVQSGHFEGYKFGLRITGLVEFQFRQVHCPLRSSSQVQDLDDLILAEYSLIHDDFDRVLLLRDQRSEPRLQTVCFIMVPRVIMVDILPKIRIRRR